MEPQSKSYWLSIMNHPQSCNCEGCVTLRASEKDQFGYPVGMVIGADRWEKIEAEEQVRQVRRWEYLSGLKEVCIGFFSSGNIYEANSPSTMLYLDEVEKLEKLGIPLVYEDSGKPCTHAELKAHYAQH